MTQSSFQLSEEKSLISVDTSDSSSAWKRELLETVNWEAKESDYVVFLLAAGKC